jgi:hypothetical protein
MLRVSTPIDSGNATENEGTDFHIIFLLEIMSRLLYTYIDIHQKLMKSVGSNEASPLACMMEVMVCYFVSDAHKIMTTLVLVVFVGTYIMVSFKVLLQSILCSLIDMGGFFWGCFWRFFNHEYGDFLILIRVISFFCSDLVLFAYCSEGAPLPHTAVNMAATDSCLVRLFPDSPSSHYLIWAMCFTLLSSHGHVNFKMNPT